MGGHRGSRVAIPDTQSNYTTNAWYIVVVSPLAHNWVIQVTADEVLPDLDSLITTIEDGSFAKLLMADS